MGWRHATLTQQIRPDAAYLPDGLPKSRAERIRPISPISAAGGVLRVHTRARIARGRKARVPICSNGGANSVAVAEHAIMLMLAVYRKLIAFHQNVAAGRWHSGLARAVDIFEIEGKTVGIVGFGHIGEQVARRLTGFDARVIYYDSVRRDSREEMALGVEYVPLDTLLIQTARLLSVGPNTAAQRRANFACSVSR